MSQYTVVADVVRAGMLLLATSLLHAQEPALNELTIRQTAVLSALSSRLEREGTAVPVGRCSVLRAIGMTVSPFGPTPSAVAASIQGEDTPSCPGRAGASARPEWRPVGEITTIVVTPRPIGGPPHVAVTLRVWQQANTYDEETYEFIASRDSLWTATSYRVARGGHVGLLVRSPPSLLVLVNGSVALSESLSDALRKLRGQVVDSIRVLSPNDSTMLSNYGSAAANGVVIIGTHPAGRRP